MTPQNSAAKLDIVVDEAVELEVFVEEWNLDEWRWILRQEGRGG